MYVPNVLCTNNMQMGSHSERGVEDGWYEIRCDIEIPEIL